MGTELDDDEYEPSEFDEGVLKEKVSRLSVARRLQLDSLLDERRLQKELIDLDDFSF